VFRIPNQTKVNKEIIDIIKNRSKRLYYNFFALKFKHNYKIVKITNGLHKEYFFAEGLENTNKSHKIDNLSYVGHMFLDIDLKDKNIDFSQLENKTKFIKEISSFAEETGAFGILFTGRGFHIEYLFDSPIHKRYANQLQKIFKEKFEQLEKVLKQYPQFFVDTNALSLYKLDRVPGTTNGKSGLKVKWIWFNDRNPFLKKEDVIGFAEIDKATDINVLKFMYKFVNFMHYNLYGENILYNNDKLKCILHKEEYPSAMLQLKKKHLGYVDFHLEPGKGISKNSLELMWSFLTDKSVVISTDMYGKMSYMLLNVLDITLEDYKKQASKHDTEIEEILSFIKTNRILKRHKTLATKIEAILLLYKEKVKNGSNNSIMLSERFVSEFTNIDLKEVNRLLMTLNAVGLLKRTHIYYMNTGIVEDIQTEEQKDDVFFTYYYKIPETININSIINNLIKVFKKYNLQQITKYLLVHIFGKKLLYSLRGRFKGDKTSSTIAKNILPAEERISAYLNLKLLKNKIKTSKWKNKLNAFSYYYEGNIEEKQLQIA